MCVGGGVYVWESERGREREREWKGERERESVCVCVCDWEQHQPACIPNQVLSEYSVTQWSAPPPTPPHPRLFPILMSEITAFIWRTFLVHFWVAPTVWKSIQPTEAKSFHLRLTIENFWDFYFLQFIPNKVASPHCMAHGHGVQPTNSQDKTRVTWADRQLHSRRLTQRSKANQVMQVQYSMAKRQSAAVNAWVSIQQNIYDLEKTFFSPLRIQQDSYNSKTSFLCSFIWRPRGHNTKTEMKNELRRKGERYCMFSYWSGNSCHPLLFVVVVAFVCVPFFHCL